MAQAERDDPERHAYVGDGTSTCGCGYPMNAHTPSASCPCCGCWNDHNGLCAACWTHQRDGMPCDQQVEGARR